MFNTRNLCLFGLLIGHSHALLSIPPPTVASKQHRTNQRLASTANGGSSSDLETGSYAPRTGLAQSLLNFALASPLWKYVLVPQAQRTMKQTAEDNGIEWGKAKEWIQTKQLQQTGGSSLEPLSDSDTQVPDYYSGRAFHAYEQGNLCWDAALEQEIASKAVGARNFPKYGQEGDSAFRQSFWRGMTEAGAQLPPPPQQQQQQQQQKQKQQSGPIIAVDMGCGTGLSSRTLATTEFEGGRYIDKVIGLDLSPYYVEVGKTLLSLASTEEDTVDGSKDTLWVNPLTDRAQKSVELRVAAAEDTGLESESVDIVQILFVLHELPGEAAVKVLEEAHRILKPGGQLWVGEMDFTAPAYAAQRANALLFSLIRATEPYLDEYADNFSTCVKSTVENLFAKVVWSAATGRHFSMVATKRENSETAIAQAIVEDYRFLPNGDYAIEDTHLQLWESKEETEN